MKRRLVYTYDADFPVVTHRPHGLGREGGTITIEGDFDITLSEPVCRYVEVRLLDGSGITSDGQRRVTWSYEDTLDPPLQKGDYVMVPFGYSNKELLAKVEACGDEPDYQGFGEIKLVSYRLGRDASVRA